MSDSAEQLPLLVSRLLEAHRSSDIPSFRLDNALIVSLHWESAPLRLRSFHVAGNRATAVTAALPIEGSPFYQLFLGGSETVLPAKSLSSFLPDDWNGVAGFQAIPLYLLCSPAAFLLLPLLEGGSPEPSFQGLSNLFDSMLRDGLYDDILQRYSQVEVKSFAAESDLVCSLARTTACWLAPLRYQVTNGAGYLVEETVYLSGCGAFDTFSFTLDGESGRYEVVFQLPSSGSPAYQLRKFNAGISIPNLWRRILEHWAHPVAYPETLLRQVEDIHRKTGEIIRAAQKTFLPREEIPAREDPPFCFYRNAGNVWVVRFDGEDCSPKTRERADKGMEVLRYLLGMPEEHFDPPLLDDLLNKSGINYKTKGSDPGRYDQELDRTKEALYREEWEMFKDYEKQIDKSPKLEQLIYWRKRKGLANLLLKFSIRPEYMRDRAKCTRKIQKLAVEVDDNFHDYSEEAFSPNPDFAYNYRNRLEAIRKAVYKALGILDPGSALYRYLEATIVCTKKGNYEPFSYQPSLERGGGPQNIDWITVPPGEE